MNWANRLTLSRLALTILFVVALSSPWRYAHTTALITFLIAGITDFFDGLTARWMNQQTPLGAILDPVADKLLVFASYLMLGAIEGVPMWLTVVIISRDVLILLGFAVIYLMLEERPEIKPTRIGKWSTMFQLLTLGVALVRLHQPDLVAQGWLDALFTVTSLATIVSGLQYLYRGFVWLQNKAPSLTRLG
jgi:cardiolipin synthase